MGVARREYPQTVDVATHRSTSVTSEEEAGITFKRLSYMFEVTEIYLYGGWFS